VTDRAAVLDALACKVRACRICVDRPIGKPLPHEPRPVLVPSATARILIAGQAPGARVHASGTPFDDRSGDRLREWMGVEREAFYDPSRIAILPMGFCFPGNDIRGGDLPPRRECAPAWRARLLELMPQVELVLVLGMHARAWHLPAHAGEPLSHTLADWRPIWNRPELPRTLPLPHPSWRNTAWLRASPWFEADVLPVLRAAVAALLRPKLE
jgi:uracil-DNA glycosylase